MGQEGLKPQRSWFPEQEGSDGPMAECPMSMTGKVLMEETQGAGVWLLLCLCIADLTLIGSGRLTAEPTGLCKCVTA